MTSQIRAAELTKLNIHAIFGEKDAAKRLQVISSTWAVSGEILFVDATGVYKAHDAISAMVEKIQSLGGPDDEFVDLSEVECLKHDVEEDIWVTRVKWGVGPKGAAPGLTGWDVLTIVGGRIKACYTFLDAQ
ncbi:hypothetical protein BU25DRAFT_487009 [Macroventuria anomochaeta]|uniref:Uncharacterized protein n=1 Tax=Macroventuria anomochaeta TaxID=301207 RepID=A0ACB6SEF2_9PLEO|nr:uncharacterized protein BU25DRAFT_487009 [Macroventuria anomochaeta]KAF2632531.1 hypothetical protein BU25DRAFT_487009 [Macroventuria anomochaeta]